MDHLSFVFSLLLIVSVTTTTFGSAIKANDPNGEVKKEFTFVIAMIKLLFATLNSVSLEMFMAFVVLFTL
jgi:hypothetical protein